MQCRINDKLFVYYPRVYNLYCCNSIYSVITVAVVLEVEEVVVLVVVEVVVLVVVEVVVLVVVEVVDVVVVAHGGDDAITVNVTQYSVDCTDTLNRRKKDY
jgi:hypothetical protein